MALAGWVLGRSAAGGLAASGALVGVLLVLLAWVVGIREPATGTAIGCAIVGAAWGTLLGFTVTRWGLSSSRVRALNKRYALQAGLGG